MIYDGNLRELLFSAFSHRLALIDLKPFRNKRLLINFHVPTRKYFMLLWTFSKLTVIKLPWSKFSIKGRKSVNVSASAGVNIQPPIRINILKWV